LKLKDPNINDKMMTHITAVAVVVAVVVVVFIVVVNDH